MIVAKIGGSAGVNLDAVADDAAALVHSGERLVIVHGASHATDMLCERLGIPIRTITSPSGHASRRTDPPTLEAFRMACRGLMNQAIVERLVRRGVNAVGLSGVDAHLWEGTRKSAIRSMEDGRVVLVRDDRSGTVERVNVPLLRTLLDAGFVPVLSPPAISREGEAINVDADRAAAITASALGAHALLLLSNVRGLLERFPDESSLIASVPRAEIARVEHVAAGRMKKKVVGAREALEGGVGRVVIADARSGMPLRQALAGEGTVFR